MESFWVGEPIDPGDPMDEKSVSLTIYLRSALGGNSRKILLDREFYDIISQC
jgi:hypothetical protein